MNVVAGMVVIFGIVVGSIVVVVSTVVVVVSATTFVIVGEVNIVLVVDVVEFSLDEEGTVELVVFDPTVLFKGVDGSITGAAVVDFVSPIVVLLGGDDGEGDVPGAVVLAIGVDRTTLVVIFVIVLLVGGV